MKCSTIWVLTNDSNLWLFPHVRITKYARVSTTHCACICTHCSNHKPNPPPLANLPIVLLT